MKNRFILTTLTTLLVLTIIIFKDANATEPCCGKKCTGSEYCTACKNCSGCAHCNSGGSCGVCRSNKSTYSSPRKKTTKSKSTYNSNTYNYNTDSYSSSKSNSTTYESFNTSNYLVNSKTLNVRKSPSISSEIICSLNEGDIVIVIEKSNQDWYQIKTECNFITVTGYVFAKYLSK